MAPASSPQLPPDRPNISKSHLGCGRHERTGEQPEIFGPLEIDRHVKGDGRALILYVRHDREHR